jgi:hypothetical protein
MDETNKPLYMQDHKSGDVYQILSVIKDRSNEENFELDTDIIFGEDEEYVKYEDYER